MYAKYIKRFLDFIVSLCAMVVLSPLYLILIVVGAICMKGNPFFVQKRPGWHERVFELLKFRTMDNRRDENGALLSDEIRLNRYGRFLRKTSLDELPELINILKGDMSIVGPRPLLVQYLPLYNEYQRHRHDIRPGLTGWAQVNGRNGITWMRKFEYDIEYVNRVSFLFDVKIIFMTIKSVLTHQGISSATSDTMEDFVGNN